MKPAVKMLRQKFRCKQRIIRSQETEKLPPLYFPALVVDFFCSSRSAQYEGSLQLRSSRSIAPSCFANRVQPPLGRKRHRAKGKITLMKRVMRRNSESKMCWAIFAKHFPESVLLTCCTVGPHPKISCFGHRVGNYSEISV